MTKKKSRSWIVKHVNDLYSKLSKKNNFRSRAFYKLKEIDEKDKLINPGKIIIDLGSYPGSWSQYIQKKINKNITNKKNSKIISIDLLPMKKINNVNFIQGNFIKDSVIKKINSIIKNRYIDLIVSDISPNISGIIPNDSNKIKLISKSILKFSKIFLKPNGVLLMKTFYNKYFSYILKKFKYNFKITKIRKPKSSKKNSSEVFLLNKFLI